MLLNSGNTDFSMAVNSKIYVDKSELMSYTNSVVNTEKRFICVSRPRRFGKSMAANMLTAYYSRGCDSREVFSSYKIAQADSHSMPQMKQVQVKCGYLTVRFVRSSLTL